MADNLVLSMLDTITSVTFSGWLLRISLLSGIACLYLALARRATPAMRHAVAVGSLLAVVLLPVASRFLPAVPLPILRAPAAVAPETPVADPTSIALDDVSVTGGNVATAGAIDPTSVGTYAAPARYDGAPASVGGRVRSFMRDAFTSTENWKRLGLVLWLMVAGGLLIRLALAFVRAHQLRARTTVIDDDAMRVQIERACRVMGIGRVPEVTLSREVSVPMVIGLARPRILLPAAATGWSSERVGIVLLHETAHIRRLDCVWMLFARLLGASLWFHPFVGLLARHVRREAERACDELVIDSGVRGSDYAEHLVSIARMSSRRNPLAGAALAFAARSTLEQRVAAILSSERRISSPRVIGAVAVASLALFVTIAAACPTESTCASDAKSDAQYQAGKLEYERARHEARREARETLQRLAGQPAIEPPASQDVEQMVQKQLAEQTVQQNVLLMVQEQTFQQSIQQAQQAAAQASSQFQIEFARNDDDDQAHEGEEWYDRAHNHYQKRRWEKAGRAYDNAARFGFRRAVAYYNAGCSYALANQPDPAMDALEAAFEEGFDDLDMYASDEDLNSLRDTPRFKKLMETVRNSDEGEQRRRAASREYDRLAERKDVDEGDWSSVGIELMRAGDHDRAATAFDNEFKLSKNTSENALYNKACARALGGKSDEALKLLEQAITVGTVDAEHMEEDPDLLSLHKNKKFGELVKLAEDLDLDYGGINHREVWSISGKKVRRISYADEVKEWKKSVSHFQEMANRHPTFGRAWFNLGYAQLKAEEPKGATPSFQKSLDLGYKPAVMMYNLACSTALSGETDAAFAWLDKSEKAGFEVWNYARWDEDLDPLRADPRYRELKKRWKEKEREHHDAHDDEHDQTIHIEID